MNEKKVLPITTETFITTMLLDMSVKMTVFQDLLKEKGLLTDEEYQNKYTEIANKISKEFTRLNELSKDQNAKK